MRQARPDPQPLCKNERISLHALPLPDHDSADALYFQVRENASGAILINIVKTPESPLACVTQTAAWLCPDTRQEALEMVHDHVAGAPGQHFHQYRKLCRLHEALGLEKPETRQPAHPEACRLQPGGLDFFGRRFMLRPDALTAWQNMQQAACADGVSLAVVSAYRSFTYQAELIRRKLAAGQKLGEILRVNAVPGASEHHSGCALDLHSPDEKDIPPLSEAFEETRAFEWLTQHAKDYGFYLSYPRGNPQGMIYEPWHWCYRLPVSA